MLEGFVSKKTGKKFSAALVLDNGKVRFDFNEKISGNQLRIRVESKASGMAHINVPGLCNTEVSYGLVSSRMAECLGSITAVKLVKYRYSESNLPQIVLSLNNLEFSRYLLRERTPRSREIRRTVEYLQKELQAFATWQARYEPKRKSRLKGSPQAAKFPRGIFPYLQMNIVEDRESLIVNLPESPDVAAQFTASIWKAKQIGPESFQVPLAAKSAVGAWFLSVRTNVLNRK